ncbi:beta-carotene hydroxylase [Synechocystis sp. FACHB-383]|uniref:beta-carotene hydroxylase n=1 Tax=unclassified Synechocystis TaxID=2640012 RepID=UPI003221806B
MCQESVIVMQATQPLQTVSQAVPKKFLQADGGFNPNVAMFGIAILLMLANIFGYWQWGLPHWLCFCCSVLALHLSGTVIHDASHNAAHRNTIVNAVLGHGSALMLGFAFPVFTRVHLQHHANVNDPENDPDHFVSTGGPLFLIAARFFYHEIFFFKRQLWRKYELLEWFLSRLVLFTIVFLGIHYGFIGFVMNYWFVPALIVGIALGLFFDYLPHRPFQERNRWKNARVYPSPILNWLIFGQNYHLIHHLWPSIPWYHYQNTYHITKPILDEKGCAQSLGLLEGKNFWSFLYDVFLGIRFHGHHGSQSSDKPS